MGLRVRIAVAVVLMVALAPFALVAGRQDAVVSTDQASAMKAEFPFVRFSLLSDFEVPALAGDLLSVSSRAVVAKEASLPPIPTAVRALDGRKVSIRGYMLPVETRGEAVTRFILASSIDSCLVGGPAATSRANEWVMVNLEAGRHVPFRKAVPTTVFGTLTISPQTIGDDLAALYRVTASAIAFH